MDLVLAHRPLEDFDLQLGTDVPHELPQADGDIRPQQLLAVLGDPHQVLLEVKARVGGPSGVLHPPRLTEVVA